MLICMNFLFSFLLLIAMSHERYVMQLNINGKAKSQQDVNIVC